MENKASLVPWSVARRLETPATAPQGIQYLAASDPFRTCRDPSPKTPNYHGYYYIKPDLVYIVTNITYGDGTIKGQMTMT